MLPLTELTKNKQSNKITFDDTHRSAFQQLKQLLCNCTMLYSPRFDKPFIVRTDASDYAIGVCVAQLDDELQEKPVAFASAKLTDVQCRWAVIEKESYAIIYALRKFDSILYGSHIDLFTDHNPLKYVVSCCPQSAKLTR